MLSRNFIFVSIFCIPIVVVVVVCSENKLTKLEIQPDRSSINAKAITDLLQAFPEPYERHWDVIIHDGSSTQHVNDVINDIDWKKVGITYKIRNSYESLVTKITHSALMFVRSSEDIKQFYDLFELDRDISKFLKIHKTIIRKPFTLLLTTKPNSQTHNNRIFYSSNKRDGNSHRLKTAFRRKKPSDRCWQFFIIHFYWCP